MTALTSRSEAFVGPCTYERSCHVPLDADGEEVADPTPEQWAAVYHAPRCIEVRAARRAELEAIEAEVRAELLAGLREAFRLTDHLNEGGPPWTLAGIERVLDMGPLPDLDVTGFRSSLIVDASEPPG